MMAGVVVAPVMANSLLADATPTQPAGQSAPAADPAPEVKVAPGSVLMVWKGKDTTEPEIFAMVDKQKSFNMGNADKDPSVQVVQALTCRWTGILNVAEPGLYTFNVVHNTHPFGVQSGYTMSLKINGTPILDCTGSGTVSKNVQIPGPANLEITMGSSNERNSVLVRYKKAGTLDYTTITPESLYHTIQ